MDGPAWASVGTALLIGWASLAGLAWLVYQRVHATRALRIILWVYLGIAAVAGTFGLLNAVSEVFRLGTPKLGLVPALAYFLVTALLWPLGVHLLVMCALPSNDPTC